MKTSTEQDRTLTLLICDDDEGDIKLFKSFLLSSGKKDSLVYSAKNEIEINEQIQEHSAEIDIIFLDYNMPDKSGLEWLEEFKKLDVAPVVMLTGFGDEVTAVEAMKKGAVDYLPKNKLDSYELSKTINNALERWNIEKERDALLGIAAHELRNPLTTLYGYSQILENYNDIDQKKRSEIYSILKERTEYLLNVVNKLLDITRIDKGTISLIKSEHNFVDFVNSRIKDLSLQAERKKIELIFSSPESKLTAIYDEERMHEVISNLLDNAIKYSPYNSKLHIILEYSNQIISLSVSDEGPGIKEEELKHLFNLFSNVKISTQPTGDEKSTGLGLAICKKIISLHDGHISVESKIGRGSKFTIHLPIN